MEQKINIALALAICAFLMGSLAIARTIKRTHPVHPLAERVLDLRNVPTNIRDLALGAYNAPGDRDSKKAFLDALSDARHERPKPAWIEQLEGPASGGTR